jgi:tetraacyldisaccharide 4'-kinase
VKPGFSVLLIDYHRPIWKDHPFPAGNLREPASGRKRADVIVVNKCPVTLTASERDRIIQKIKPSGTQSVFFTAIEYLKPVDLDGKGQSIPPDSEVLVLAGISQPDVFIGHLSDKYKISDTVIYPDHYSFSKKDYLYIKNKLGKTEGGRRIIITTEKDMVRLKNMPWLEDDVSKRIWYIPIRLNFLFEEENKFNQLIYSYVEKNKKDS